MLSQIPVLVYCHRSIMTTGYVENYALAGSTVWTPVVRDYIRGLARGFDDSVQWARFNVTRERKSDGKLQSCE